MKFIHALVLVQSIRIDPGLVRNEWQGWGTSLAWWGVGVGGSAWQDLLADAVFSRKTVQLRGRDYPGLGLNIVRYNVGGGGQSGDIPSLPEKRPEELPWFKDVDGFWIDWNNSDPTSSSWNWSRDASQRSLLQAAVARGVDQVELFSNAPMWWMMDSHSSAGGRLQTWNQQDFANYLATVATVAIRDWHVPVTSISPFNEPSATWWKWPKNQEGCTIPWPEQSAVIQWLDEALHIRGLDSLQLTASEENTMREAKAGIEYFDHTGLGTRIDKINVHSYDGISPWRDNTLRQALKKSAKSRPIWASEYGDNDGSGAELAQTIIEDLTYLQPSAWIYWQIVEPWSAWGAINADLEHDGKRGEPSWVYLKFQVFAHFTRFIRPGMKILEQAEPNLVVGFDPQNNSYAGVLVNRGQARQLTLHLPKSGTAQLTRTAFDSSSVWQTSEQTTGGQLLIEANAGEIISFTL